MTDVEVRIGEVSGTIRGVTYEKQDAREVPGAGYLPLLRATNIEGGTLSFDGLVYVPARVVSNEQRLRDGDIVLAASSGSLSVVGKAALFHGDREMTFGAFCYAVRPDPIAVLAEYLARFMETAEYRGGVSKLAAGVNINNLRREHIEGFRLPFVGIEQQRRIVDAIDSYLSHLDAAVAALEAAQKRLKAYRSSVLKSAVEGRLVATEAALARAEKRDFEPADVLLKRILSERRRRWQEAELAKLKAAGKSPKDDKWKAKYEEPTPPDTKDLPELPEGWCWATSDQLFSFVTSGSRGWAGHYSDSGPVFIRIGNLDHDSISLDLADTIHVSPPAGAEGLRTRVRPGDILVSITADVGMIALVGDHIGEAYINQHVSLARPVTGPCFAYLAWYLACRDGGQSQFLKMQRGATKVGLGLDDIRSVLVPLAPAAEQERIVGEAERLLSVAANASQITDSQRARAARLRQSILKWGFEGKLVDQDPNDEAAETLLERIRVERQNTETPKKTRRPRNAQ